MLSLKLLSLAITALLFFLVSGEVQALAAQYPLKVSVDGRHLEDQAGHPFLINGDTPWTLTVGLTKAEAEIYLEDRRSRGFNTIIYEIPKWDGDIGMPNTFVHLDEAMGLKKIKYLQQIYNYQKTKAWFTDNLFWSLMRVRGMESNSPSQIAEAFYSRKSVLKL